MKIEVTSCYGGGNFLDQCQTDYGNDPCAYAETGGTEVFLCHSSFSTLTLTDIG